MSAPITKKAYVPPSLRVVEKEKPAELQSEDLKSKDMFPSLSTTTAVKPGATWARLRERLAPAAASATAVPLKTENQFAALDEDKPATPTTPVPLNFKGTIDAALKREAAEREAAELQAATEDPLQMTPEQLAENGWASLPLPQPTERIVKHRALADKLWAAEQEARATEQLFRNEPFDTVGIPREILDAENTHAVFVHCMGAEAAGPDPWELLKPKSERAYLGTSTPATEAAARERLMKFRPRVKA